jgi:hypothetical protein
MERGMFDLGTSQNTCPNSDPGAVGSVVAACREYERTAFPPINTFKNAQGSAIQISGLQTLCLSNGYADRALGQIEVRSLQTHHLAAAPSRID